MDLYAYGIFIELGNKNLGPAVFTTYQKKFYPSGNIPNCAQIPPPRLFHKLKTDAQEYGTFDSFYKYLTIY